MKRLPLRTSVEYRRDGKTIERAFLCPVCKYPTIYEPGAYEICDLCNWEDDDFDEGGPNGDYTLTEARKNFQGHLSMYRLSHEISPQFQSPGFPIHIVEIEQKRGITKLKEGRSRSSRSSRMKIPWRGAVSFTKPTLTSNKLGDEAVSLCLLIPCDLAAVFGVGMLPMPA